MINQFSVQNFKSLRMSKPVVFCPRLNVLIGLNGSGKTSLLQAIGFVTQLGQRGGAQMWLERRGWADKDLQCALKVGGKSVVENPTLMTFTMDCGSGDQSYEWQGAYSLLLHRCVEESLKTKDDSFGYRLGDKKLAYQGEYGEMLKQLFPSLQYDGAFLSLFSFPKMKELQVILNSCYSLDLLSPQLMRGRIRRASDAGVGNGGEQIAHFLKKLSRDKAKQGKLDKLMQRFYPSYCGIGTKTVRGGSVRFSVQEKFAEEYTLVSDSSQLCDGLLRVLAITAQTLECKGGTLLIDELEDGINPELLDGLIRYLQTEAPCQTIITTHNPLVLSCMTDFEAEESVNLVFKDQHGFSACARFFDLPTPKKMLESGYPGEVMLQCNLQQVANEALQYVGDSK